MEVTSEVSNVEKNFYIIGRALYKIFYSKFETSLVTSIWHPKFALFCLDYLIVLLGFLSETHFRD